MLREAKLAPKLVVLLFSALLVSTSAGASKKINGVCGPANGVAASTAPTSGLCTAGSSSAVTGLGPWLWTCLGQNGGATASCAAPALPAAPTLTLTLVPSNPTLVATAPFGQLVAVANAAWSDGSAFNGTLGFAAPYFDDNGGFVLIGKSIVTNADFSALANTMQFLTIEAVP